MAVRFQHAAVLIVTAFIAVGCEVSVQNGVVPAEYQEPAKQYVGSYSGQFAGEKMDLTLKIATNGRAILNLQPSTGHSSILEECRVVIGLLTTVDVDNHSQQLKSARFQFSSDSNCGIEGQEIILRFKDKNQIAVSVIERTAITHGPQQCYGSGEYKECYEGIDQVVVKSWLKGAFQR